MSIKGDPEHLLSAAAMSAPRPPALADLEDDPDRLRRPVKRVGGDWQEIELGHGLCRNRRAHGGRFVARAAQPAVYIGNPNAHNYAIRTQVPGRCSKAMKLRTLYSASTVDQVPHQLDPDVDVRPQRAVRRFPMSTARSSC